MSEQASRLDSTSWRSSGAWAPEGGGLGVAVGVSALLAAWLATELLEPIDVMTGADDRIASLAMAVLGLLCLSTVVTLAIIRFRPQDAPCRRPTIGIVIVVATVMSGRILMHEIAIGVSLPASGGVDSIVRVTGRVLHRPEPVATSFARESAEDEGRWRTQVHVEKATRPGLAGRRLTVALDVEDPRMVPQSGFGSGFGSGMGLGLRSGVEVEILGRFRPMPAPSNPGERDRRRGRRDQVPGVLIVPSSGLITVSDADPGISWSTWIAAGRSGWADAVDRVGRAADAHRPGIGGLVGAVLRGDREHLGEGIRWASEDAGVAPLLAISGWHLALIGAFASVMLGRHRPVGRCLAFAAVVAFSLVVIPGAGVRRAAVMAVIAGVARAAGRRPRGLPVVLVTGSALVWDDPSLAESIAFRLSMIATMALVIGADRGRNRWFGKPDRVGRSPASSLHDRFAWLSAASIVAWSSTAPIVATTFGRLSLAGVPAMIIVTQLFAGFVLLTIVAVVWTLVVGFCPETFAEWIAVLGSMFTSVVEGVAAVAPIWRCPTPPDMAGWFVIPSIVIAIGLGFKRNGMRRGMVAVGIGCAIGLMMLGDRSGTRPSDDRLRIDVIAVGDGSALLVRGEGGAVLQDAGSSSVPEAGRRIIVPALRSLDVRRLDAIVITHANADHFNAVLDVIRAMPVGRIVMSPHLIHRARTGRSSVLSSWIERVQASDVEIIEVGRGDRLRFGDLMWTILHPDRDDRCRTANDESIVTSVGLRGDAEDRSRLLVCGDVQDEAIARVLAREPGLRTVVMELPHHGSWRPIAAAMLERADPAAVVQSTGPDRWRMDRWKGVCAGRWRGVTCRDGLVSFEVDSTGRVHTILGDWSRGPGSEEPESGLMPAAGGPSIGSGPDHHDRAIQPTTLGKHRHQHAGHPLEERGAGRDSNAGLADIERPISDGLSGLEVPRHHHFGIHGGSRRIPAVGGRIRVPSHGRIVQHDPVTSADWSRRFRRVVENSPRAEGLCRGGNLGRDPPDPVSRLGSLWDPV